MGSFRDVWRWFLESKWRLVESRAALVGAPDARIGAPTIYGTALSPRPFATGATLAEPMARVARGTSTPSTSSSAANATGRLS